MRYLNQEILFCVEVLLRIWLYEMIQFLWKIFSSKMWGNIVYWQVPKSSAVGFWVEWFMLCSFKWRRRSVFTSIWAQFLGAVCVFLFLWHKIRDVAYIVIAHLMQWSWNWKRAADSRILRVFDSIKFLKYVAQVYNTAQSNVPCSANRGLSPACIGEPVEKRGSQFVHISIYMPYSSQKFFPRDRLQFPCCHYFACRIIPREPAPESHWRNN